MVRKHIRLRVNQAVIAGAVLAWTVLVGFGCQSVSSEQALAEARAFALRAGLGTIEAPEVEPLRSRGRVVVYYVNFNRQGRYASITVDAVFGRARGFGYPDRLYEARRGGTSGGGRFATVAEARQFALALASRLYADRTLTVTSFERLGNEWKLKANHAVLRHGYPFVDQSFTLTLSIDARDGTLLAYGEKYTIPETEAPPAQPISKARAYEIATGRPLPSGAVIDARLGYAQSQSGTGPAVLCWRYHNPGRANYSISVTYYVDARRETVIKTEIKK